MCSITDSSQCFAGSGSLDLEISFPKSQSGGFFSLTAQCYRALPKLDYCRRIISRNVR